MADSFFVHMQCYRNERAVYECVSQFRKHFDVPFDVVGNGGYDFTPLLAPLNVHYTHKDVNLMPGGKFGGTQACYRYLESIYLACSHFSEDWVVLFEEDVW